DIDQVRAEWREAASIDFEESLCQSLHKLDLVEREAWSAWQRSQAPLGTAVRTEGSASNITSRSSLKHSYGDPRFLDLVHKCVSQRSLLLGLNAAAPAAGDLPHDHEPLEVRRERILSTMARLGFTAGGGAAGAGCDVAEPGDVRRDGECGEVAAGPAP